MVTRRWMTPASSRRLMRRQQGLEDNPTRSAISATDRPASCWIRSRILASTASRTSDKFSTPSCGLRASFLPRNRQAGARFWQAIATILYDLLKPARGAEGRKLRCVAQKCRIAARFCSSPTKTPAQRLISPTASARTGHEDAQEQSGAQPAHPRAALPPGRNAGLLQAQYP